MLILSKGKGSEQSDQWPSTRRNIFVKRTVTEKIIHAKRVFEEKITIRKQPTKSCGCGGSSVKRKTVANARPFKNW